MSPGSPQSGLAVLISCFLILSPATAFNCKNMTSTAGVATRSICPTNWTASADTETAAGLILTNLATGQAEIIFDYSRAEGGMPFLEVANVVSEADNVEVDIIFSETYEGTQSETGK